MCINKNKLKNKLLQDFEDEIRHTCSICKNTITKNDIQDQNFEYVKNKFGENYAHSSCIKYNRKAESDV